jgi:hypothetical protein
MASTLRKFFLSENFPIIVAFIAGFVWSNRSIDDFNTYLTHPLASFFVSSIYGSIMAIGCLITVPFIPTSLNVVYGILILTSIGHYLYNLPS